MDKGCRIEDVSRLLKRAKAAGIFNHLFIICGFPTETEAEYAQTIKFLEDHKDCIYAVHRGTFGLEPQSPIFEHPDQFGITRKWIVRDTPAGGERWGFEVSSGMSQQRALEVLTVSLPLLREFNPFAQFLANHRDHALLVYSRRGSQLRPENRRFPPMYYAQQPLTPWRTETLSEDALTYDATVCSQ